MTLEQKLDKIAGTEYPHKVDVVDGVMAEVEKHPYMRPKHAGVAWGRISTIAASIAVMVIGTGVVLNLVRTPDGEADGGFGAADNPAWNTVEEPAVAPADTIQPLLSTM